jgi:hypothetical protein
MREAAAMICQIQRKTAPLDWQKEKQQREEVDE